MKNIDYKLFITIVLLIIFWVIMISSVSVFSSFDITNKQFAKWLIDKPYNYFYLMRSISHVVIWLIALAIIVKIKPSFFEKYSPYFLWVSIILIIISLLTAQEIKWAKWWIIIQWLPFVIQPTEFFKISLIIFLAMIFKKYNHYLKDFKKWFIPYIWLVITTVLIIWLIPDFWTLLILIPVTGIMFFYAWANKKHIASLWILWILLFATVYYIWTYDKETWQPTNKLWYITLRIDNFFKSNEEIFKTVNTEWNDSRTDQTKQSLITIWSWWAWWKWFWESIQKFWYLPEVQWDFIFSVIIEEFWLRWVLIIIAYLYIWYRWFYISYNVRDKFQKFASLWITSWILFQAFINIWVTLNVVPLTWVTLPFISYWWSSMLSLCIWTWILLSISRNIEEKPKYARMNKQKFIF